ncbi:MAG TPA: hypothetical protein VJC18_00485 [bacterium]|nr:hypothetical protein [bacterium]
MTQALVLVCACLLVTWDVGAAVSKRPEKASQNGISQPKTKAEAVIRSEAGLNIQEWGIAIDAIFDPRLDDLIPGYHVVNLVLTNRRGEPIELNTKQDKWYIVDSLGKKHTAYNHVKQFKDALWPKLPQKMRDMLEYPHIVNAGKSTNIDVFLPKSVDLFHFREVIWKSAHFNKEFNILTNYEKELSIDQKKEFDLPKKITAEEELLMEENRGQLNPEAASQVSTPPNTPENSQPQALELNEQGTSNTSTPQASVEGFIRVK